LVTAYLGLGSNLGDREGNIAKAINLLSQKVRVERVSSLYETDPVGYKEQPLFLNAVCCISTELSPQRLLALVKGIENLLGRVSSFPNAPRIIDVDILFYGDQVIETPELTIPHPHLPERAFVLVPLAEIAPGLMHPQKGRSAAGLLEEVKERGGVRKWSGEGKASLACMSSNEI
jgi:2-amino-4-hydroxy-6-hydroxymethyldihydropteridine diphosphokinase